MSWSHPRSWLAEKINADKLNTEIRDNFDALKNPPHDEYAPAYQAGALISTSSSSFVVMTGFELTLETTGGDVLIILNIDISQSAYFDISVNGSRVGGNDGIQAAVNTASRGILLIWLLTEVEAQTLSIQAVWKTNGTAQIEGYSRPYFSAREIS